MHKKKLLCDKRNYNLFLANLLKVTSISKTKAELESRMGL